MADFASAIQVVLANEGALSNNVSDPGGLTKYGISQKAYPTLDIGALTLPMAERIYQTDYWRYDTLNSQSVATKLLDMSVNLGLHKTTELLQMALVTTGLSIAVDGVLGPNTLLATNTAGDSVLLDLRTEQQNYYVSLVQANPALQVFLKGWLRRANEV
jgi:lysozyme family protein